MSRRKLGACRGRALAATVAATVLAGGGRAVTATPAPAVDSPATQPRTASAVLDPIIVSALRSATAAFDTPYTVQVLDGTDLTDSLVRSTPDALRTVPGVMVQKTSPGQGSPYIRGFTGFRTLLLIDGIRLNNSTFREGPNQYWNTVDPYSIERMEVLKGPASVLYGSDAVGGVVNAVTRSPSSYGEGWQYDARALLRGSTAERALAGHFDVSVTQDQALGFYLGASARNLGDIQGGSEVGIQNNTGYDEYSVDAKLEWFINSQVSLVGAHQRVRQNNVPRTHATVDGVSFRGTTVGTDRRRDLDQERELTYLQLHAQDLEGAIQAVRASLSWHHQAEAEDRITSALSRRLQAVDVDTLGFWAQLESATPLGRLVYGVEYYRDFVDSSSNTSAIQGPVADEASYDMLGLFVENTIPICPAVDVVLGGRYTYAAADADRVRRPTPPNDAIGLHDSWDALVGSGRVLWKVDPERHWNLFGGVSQGFRAPNLSDLSRFDIARSGELETAAPGLEPERFLSFEVGVKAQYTQVSFQAAYFHTLIDDMIVRRPTGAIVGGLTEVTKANAGDGFVHGVELEAILRLSPEWSVSGNFTWMQGEVDQYPTAAPTLVREPLSRVMPPTANLGLRWDSPDGVFWASTTLTIAARADELSTADRADTQRIPPGGTPGYVVWSANGGWRVTPATSLFLGVQNLTDAEYRIHGSGSNEPGVNVVMGCEVTF